MLQDWLVDVPNAITRIWAEQGIYSFAPSPAHSLGRTIPPA